MLFTIEYELQLTPMKVVSKWVPENLEILVTKQPNT